MVTPCKRLSAITSPLSSSVAGKLQHRKVTHKPFLSKIWAIVACAVLIFAALSQPTSVRAIDVPCLPRTPSYLQTQIKGIQSTHYLPHYNRTPYQLNAALGGQYDSLEHLNALPKLSMSLVRRNEANFSVSPRDMSSSIMQGDANELQEYSVPRQFIAIRVANEEGEQSVIIWMREYPDTGGQYDDAYWNKWVAAGDDIFVQNGRDVDDRAIYGLATLYAFRPVLGNNGRLYRLA